MQSSLEFITTTGISNIQSASLMQVYISLVIRVSTLAITHDFGDPARLMDSIVQQLQTMRGNATAQGKNRDQITDAQYAIIAYVDETVSGSEWEKRGEWNRMPLRTKMNVEPNAGTVFFDKLDSWLHNPTSERKEILEIFYVCLGLGFRGKYFQDQHTLNEIKRRVQNEIALSPHPPSRLSPTAFQEGEVTVAARDSFPWSWFVAGLVSVLLLEFILFKMLSSSQIKEFVHTLSTSSM